MSANQLSDAAGLLRFFHGKFDWKAASAEELEFLGKAGEYAPVLAANTADLLSGTAEHIDEEREAGRDVKEFHGLDMSVHLANIADTIRVVAELAVIGSEADYFLVKQAKAKKRASHANQDE